MRKGWSLPGSPHPWESMAEVSVEANAGSGRLREKKGKDIKYSDYIVKI